MKTNSEVRYASHPQDAKHYDTRQLREHYLIETVFTADEARSGRASAYRYSPQRIFPVKKGDGNIQCRRQRLCESRR